MSNAFELSAEKRECYGKRANRRLRRLENKVPAIVYGGGKASQALMLNHDEAIVALQEEAFYSHILTVNVGEDKEQVVLKAVQRHPYKNKVSHLDFLRVKSGEKLTMQVPLHFIGEDVAPGVEQQAGVVNHHLNDVEIRCLPKDLPEFIEVDLSNMALDQVLHLSDLKLPVGVELTALSAAEPNDEAVIAIHLSKVTNEDTADEQPDTETAADTEGEQPAEDKSEQAADKKED